MRIAINGRYIVRKQTGQERFAQELVREIDKIVKPGEFTLVVPQWAEDRLIPHYKNIAIVKYGNVKSHFWEQTNFWWWVKKHKMISMNLTTTCPLLCPGIVCLHDCMEIEASNMLAHNTYSRLSLVWHKLIFCVATKKAKRILTVSEYSKKKLHELLNVPTERISVIYNAWQHYNHVAADYNIFEKLPKDIERKQYYMALSSMTPQKNFKWICEVAKRNPKVQFVVTGSKVGLTLASDANQHIENIHFTGFLTDGEVKALMTECMAFIHPAVYEGFGIPPLEAMSCGAPLILSTCTCLPEIYEKSAHYIDPYNYDVDLDKLLAEPVETAKNVLDKFDWTREAKKLYDVLSKEEG